MQHITQWIRMLGLSPLLAACGGGGGGGSSPPAYDLTGYWQLYLTPTGTTTEIGPLAVYFSQNGATFDGVDVTGSMNGSSFSLQADGGTFLVALTGTASNADNASGGVTFSGAVTGSGTFQLTRFDPAGTMTANGSLDGTTIAASSTTAIGIRTYADAGLSTLTEVTVALVDNDIDLELTFAPGALAVATLAVPSPLAVDVLLRVDDQIVDAAASGGSVDITRYDGTGIAGTYTVVTSVGTITGAFDVTFDIAEYAP